MKKLLLLALLSASSTSFGMLRLVKKISRVRGSVRNLRARRLLPKIVPTITMQKRFTRNQVGEEQQREKLEKKLDRLTNQLKLCTSFCEKNYYGGSATNGGYIWMGTTAVQIEHPSVWQPSNKEHVKACCDKCFDEWVKVQEKLGRMDREQE